MKKKKTLWGLAAAAGLTLLAGIGLLEKADLRALDLWYQTRRPTDGDVVMVEIDDRALEAIGPYEEWGRGIMAQVIETLNKSEECRPAAIGLDVLYTGAFREILMNPFLWRMCDTRRRRSSMRF